MDQSRTRAGQPTVCSAPKCGRPRYARGYCQTHHRQLLMTGKTKPIRPYRPRSSRTVKFAGLRLTPECANILDSMAEERGLSVGATIADVLENAVVKSHNARVMSARQRRQKT